MSSSNISTTLWKDFLASLNKKLNNPMLSSDNYLPTSGVAAANWQFLNTTGTLPGTPGETIVIDLETWCDNMPLWKSNYVPGNSFYDNYSLFLYALQLVNPGDPAQQQIANAWQKKVQTCQNNINQYRIDSAKAWTAFNEAQKGSGSSISYSDWYTTKNEGPNKPNGPSWATTISQEEKTKANALENYQEALERLGGEGYDELTSAINKLKLSASAGNQILDKNGVAYPDYSVSPDLNKWFLQSLAKVDDPPLLNFSIFIAQGNIATQSTSSQISEASPFFTTKSSSTVSNQTSILEEMSLKYKAQNAQFYQFTPGKWYDSDFMNNYPQKENSIYKINPQSALYGKDIFGQNGILNLRTDQVLVVFRSSIEISGSEEQISSFNSSLSGSNSIDIAGSTFNISDMEKNSTSVKFASNSNTPQVIGVIPQKLGQ